MDARGALERLKEGNRRFASNVRSVESLLSQMRRDQLADGQKPFAIVLGCSDSRAPAEIVFDQGLGDLFVIRVAGNVVAPSQIGSVEFAAERFGTRLVVVMGHTSCGAISATLDHLTRPEEPLPGSLRSIVDRVKPALEPVVKGDTRDLVMEATRANVRHSVEQIRRGSPILEGLIANAGLLVVGAVYDIRTGEVEFLDGA